MRSSCVSDCLTCCGILHCFFSEILNTHLLIAEEQDSNKGSSVVSAIIQAGHTGSGSGINLLILPLGSEIKSQRITLANTPFGASYVRPVSGYI
jgi:hypothetical protein